MHLGSGEAPKAFSFVGLGFLLQVGLVLGITNADSLFLSHVGPPGLPAIYILQTVVMALHTAAFVMLIKRFGIDRLFDGALMVMALGGVMIGFAFNDGGSGHTDALYYAVKLYTGMWYFGIYTLFWTFLDYYYDLTDAKRLYALFAAGSAAGAIVAGGLVSLLAAHVGPGTFYLMWAAIAAATWPALAAIRRRWRRIEVSEITTEPGDGGLREAFAGITELGSSRYAVALTVGFFLIAVTATICDYQYMRVFSIGRDEAQLAMLFGRVTLIANLANMLITLFLFNPLVSRFGVRNIALLQPLIFGGVFLWFVGAPGMGAAVAGYLAYHALMMAIDINNGNLLVFGLPAKRRKEVRTFIEGICLPAAAATAGLFLLIIAPSLSLRAVAMIGLGSAALTFTANIVVRQDYVGAIAANIRAGWPDLPPLTPRHDLGDRNESLHSLASVSNPLHNATGNARVGRMEMLAKQAGVHSITLLLNAADEYTAGERRLADDLIVAMGPAAIPALVKAAESRHQTVRARSIALRALGKLDFVRLRSIAKPLMLRTAHRTYEYLGRYSALVRPGAADAGSIVLQRINRDYPMLTLEIVLEVLTIAGQLPPYEAIAAALSGGPSRDRGFAVETVEQGAGRNLARLLTPWISCWQPDRQLSYAKEQNLLPALDEREAMDRALASAFPLEAAAAGQALWERGEPQHLIAKRSILPHGIVAETLRVLEARQRNEDAGLTPIECVAAVMRVTELAFFLFVHLEWLALQLKTVRVHVGENLAQQSDLIEGVGIVVEGSIVAHSGNDTYAIGVGSVASLRTWTGKGLSLEQLTAGEGLQIVILPTTHVFACATAFPELGIELLRQRLTGG